MPKSTDMLPMPSAYFQLLLREFGRTPELEAALRDGTGVAAGDIPTEITVGQQRRQVRNVAHLAPPGWALQGGDLFDASTHGPVAFAGLSAPTLGDGMTVVTRNVSDFTPTGVTTFNPWVMG